MSAADLRFTLYILMACLGFGAVFVVLLPMILIRSMLGSASSTIAAAKSHEDTQ